MDCLIKVVCWSEMCYFVYNIENVVWIVNLNKIYRKIVEKFIFFLGLINWIFRMYSCLK